MTDDTSYDNDQVVECVYDENGNVVTYKALYGATNGSSLGTIHAYDDFDRLTKPTFADASDIDLTYDDAGNVITKRLQIRENGL